MNPDFRRCLRLAMTALPFVAAAVSIVLGLGTFEWFAVVLAVVGVGVTAFLGALANVIVGGRFRAARKQGRPVVLALIAALLPDLWALSWAEEMHAQLLELTPAQRRRLQWNLVTRASVLWLGTWRVHRQYTRRRRYRGNTLMLVTRLDTALRAPGRDERISGRFAVLHAIGMSRTRACQPIRRVHALALARRLLATDDPFLDGARDSVRRLLATREEAQLLTRGLRRLPGLGWPQTCAGMYGPQCRRVETLRDTAQQQVSELQGALRSFMDT